MLTYEQRQEQRVRAPCSREHMLGHADAPLIILEYGCYCSPREPATYAAIAAVLDAHPGDAAYVYRHFPLVATYPTAFLAAEAAEAAAAQGRFWDMHAYLASHARQYTLRHLVYAAMDLGLDSQDFARDLQSHTHSETVAAHYHSAVYCGIRRVPAVFINGRIYDGDISADGLERALRSAAETPGPEVGNPPTHHGA